MEKDTVLLAVEKYNELRDFKKYIENGNTLEVSDSRYSSYRKFITTDEAVKQVIKDMERLKKEYLKEVAELVKQIAELESSNKPKEITLNDIKKMTYWEFRKWRKS